MAILTSKGVKAPHQLNGVRKVRISRDRRGAGSEEKTDIEILKGRVDDIESVIPSDASSENKLTAKDSTYTFEDKTSETLDLNDISTVGVIAYGDTNVSHAPSEYPGTVQTFPINGFNDLSQIAIDAGGSVFKRVKSTSGESTIWTDWSDLSASVIDEATGRLTSDGSGFVNLMSLFPSNTTVEIISIAGTTSDSNKIYLPFKNSSGNWYVMIYNWDGTKISTTTTVDLKVVYRIL